MKFSLFDYFCDAHIWFTKCEYVGRSSRNEQEEISLWRKWFNFEILIMGSTNIKFKI
jgi:hypothetical protein